jgi:hypothetical protein
VRADATSLVVIRRIEYSAAQWETIPIQKGTQMNRRLKMLVLVGGLGLTGCGESAPKPPDPAEVKAKNAMHDEINKNQTKDHAPAGHNAP